MSASGQCLCGKVMFTASHDVSEVGVCHCSMCLRWVGGPSMATHPGPAPTINGAENLTWFESSEWAERGFCANCGSSMFYRLKGETPQYSIHAGAFDDQTQFKLAAQIFIDEKVDYYDFAGDIPSMTGAEVFEMFAQSNDSSEG